jgi:hypothetical protein
LATAALTIAPLIRNALFFWVWLFSVNGLQIHLSIIVSVSFSQVIHRFPIRNLTNPGGELRLGT